MLKDHHRACTGANCKVCRHLGRQRAVAAHKRRRAEGRLGGAPAPHGGAPAQGPAGAADH